MNNTIIAALSAFALSFFFTVLVRRFALLFGWVDRPEPGSRKIHARATPLAGGIGIFLAFALVLLFLLMRSNILTAGLIDVSHYLGVLLGGCVLMIGGLLDDRFHLPPRFSFIAPVLASLLAVGFGIEIEKLTNPFGGVVFLQNWQSDALVFLWLLTVIYTTKFLDGLDGLATSVTLIGVVMILLLSLTAAYFQPDVAVLSAIAIGALAGFLFWNIHPASIFLGESGSTFVGYLLGILAVISGGKLAVALLVLGIPFLDLVWVVLRRFRAGGFKRIFQGDRKHLHHRLFNIGWNQRLIMLVYMFVATSFGASALFLQSREKVVALVILVLLMLIAALALVHHEKGSNPDMTP